MSDANLGALSKLSGPPGGRADSTFPRLEVVYFQELGRCVYGETPPQEEGSVVLGEGKLRQVEACVGLLLGVCGVSDIFLSVSFKKLPLAVAHRN